MKVAMLTTDAREHWREYQKTKPYFGTPQEALLKAAADFPSLELHVISCWQKPMQAPERLAPNIWFHGLLVPKIGWLRTGYQGCVRAVRQKVKQLKPDVVHGQGTERDCGMSAALSGFPNVITIHGNMKALARTMKAPIGSFQWCAAVLENVALKRTGGVLCNSAHTEKQVAGRTRRIWQVPNPLRTEFFSPAHDSPTRKCMLLNVGTISELKQPLQLLNLAEQWYASGLQFELSFVGKAEPQSAYVRQFLERIARAERAGYARYLGMKSAEELVALYDYAHALVHVPQEEAFGLVVAEALARNVKLFAFATGGIVGIVRGIQSAQLSKPGDWPDLSHAIGSWIQAGYPRPTGSAEIMQSRYHPRVIVDRHMAVYEEILREP